MINGPIKEEEDEDTTPKSSVQTRIDLHMKEIDAYVDHEISFFDERVKSRTVTRLVVFEKNPMKLSKDVKA